MYDRKEREPMRGLDLDALEEVSEKLGIPFAEVRECFDALEAEGNAFRVKDEVTGKTLWFHSSELERETEDV
jgi:hypothetical protein